ncbi:serine/threonine-protein phosphatase [Colidextribacter sp. 210702-DFI.3.9]|uniref:Serine/threonine-protein phosphatase n=1 Tax=Flintibacter faecis TaxID=2763047 RepID=A0A8J6IVY1_9FIRM|nr:PP2C family serine/threonine-protein phosphatase [Flintibacter faecis]MBC5716764.1 serine/threonine-protein phosphatase [Flintibacter faecis]MCB6500561.1 serine/threonine-protein phosphatase [Colidextribacter sp. 210702-DFI.3.9]MCG4469215.1 serine/threonine-protein phosphatase [Lawsonibacter sp. DFI.6.74]MCG4772901.1 serine/threonine-protein phosphatase [Lawsonibacter sp. DFI.5.51]
MACVYDGISLTNGRAVNMDSLLLKSRTVAGTEVCLAAVCDGVGSLADGALSAQWAVQMLYNWLENLEDAEELGARLRDYVQTMNLAIRTKAQKQQAETACTLSCLLLWRQWYCLAHVGDSRIYLWEQGALRQLTQDQARRGRLTQAMGHREHVTVFFQQGEQRGEQRFLLCSDGLYKRMEPETLGACMARLNRRSLQKALRQLTEHVISQGERDNISAALLIKDER